MSYTDRGITATRLRTCDVGVGNRTPFSRSLERFAATSANRGDDDRLPFVLVIVAPHVCARSTESLEASGGRFFVELSFDELAVPTSILGKQRRLIMSKVYRIYERNF